MTKSDCYDVMIKLNFSIFQYNLHSLQQYPGPGAPPQTVYVQQPPPAQSVVIVEERSGVRTKIHL